MDREIKKLISKTKGVEKAEKSLLKKDIKQDKIVAAAKKAVKKVKNKKK